MKYDYLDYLQVRSLFRQLEEDFRVKASNIEIADFSEVRSYREEKPESMCINTDHWIGSGYNRTPEDFDNFELFTLLRVTFETANRAPLFRFEMGRRVARIVPAAGAHKMLQGIANPTEKEVVATCIAPFPPNRSYEVVVAAFVNKIRLLLESSRSFLLAN